MDNELKQACSTCVYSFPDFVGDSGTKYSCCITSKPMNEAVIRCEAYRRRAVLDALDPESGSSASLTERRDA